MPIPKHPLFERLAAAGQDHVLAFYGELSETSRAQLDRQLDALDLDELATLVRREHVAIDWADLARRAVPPTSYPSANPSTDAITPEAAHAAGEAALRQGQVAAIIVAGGQGSRLGFEHPKGMFSIGPVSGHSLFQILIEKVVSTARLYGSPVPLYVMTSPATHEETVQYLDANSRFGLAPDDLHVFCQGTMPAVDAQTGKLLLAAKDSLALAPDGHGGMLAALQRTGALAHARQRGIEMFSYVQVDNPLAQLCHPQLIGYHMLADSDMTTQVVRKQDPLERVGNVVMVDGQMRIIEYSDLPERYRRGAKRRRFVADLGRQHCRACVPLGIPRTDGAAKRSSGFPRSPQKSRLRGFAAVHCRRRRSPMRSSSNDSSSICCPGPGIRSWWKVAAKKSSRRSRTPKARPPIHLPPRATRWSACIRAGCSRRASQ